jgi:hypothetical protein
MLANISLNEREDEFIKLININIKILSLIIYKLYSEIKIIIIKLYKLFSTY